MYFRLQGYDILGKSKTMRKALDWSGVHIVDGHGTDITSLAPQEIADSINRPATFN